MCRVSPRETDEWYFDSGCSKHMTGEKRMLKDIVYKRQGNVMCGNGNSNAIVGKGRLPLLSDSKIKHALLVEGLKHNLISIAQVCDKDCEVNFTKHGCKVVNKEGKIIMTGSRKTDNTYTLDGDIKCPKTSTENLKIRHKKFGHIGTKKLANLSKSESEKGLGVITYDPDRMCGDCKVEKNTQVKHPIVSYNTAKRPLKLPHIDLMGPMLTPSLEGNSYTFVSDDDFSRYSWDGFFKENFNASTDIIKLSYKLWREVLTTACYMLDDKEPNRKRASKSNREVFVGYSARMGVKEDGELVFNQPQSTENTPGVEALETEGVGMNENAPSVEASYVSTDIRNAQETMPDVTNQNLYLFVRDQRNCSTTDIVGNITRNNVHLVAQGYIQVKGIHFGETVAQLETISLLIAVTAHGEITLCQMDDKSAFHIGYLNKEIYVEQSIGFTETTHPDSMHNLTKAPYGQKQDSQA
ncbi:uncharacterized protein [Rutidosis leptorrhynchoides]|uniref:uncharacterized protein n=1 Tax=Rutidosis leptorrhynchoides TaxID=125765 RepID=UPI003A9A5A6A